MTQLEATVTAIEFIREQSPDDKRVLQALKVLEKRHSVLLARHEARYAKLAPDLFDEPLTIGFKQVMSIYHGDICVKCLRKKAPRFAFCVDCFRLLDPSTRKASHGVETFHHFFCRALRLLDLHPVRGEDGMLGWPNR